jgi:hypothetical protein
MATYIIPGVYVKESQPSNNRKADLRHLVSIIIVPGVPTATVGNNQYFSAIGIYSDQSSETLTVPVWTSSDTSVATIDSAGIALCLSPGTTTISAKYNGITGFTTLTSIPIVLNWSITTPMDQVRLNMPAIRLANGKALVWGGNYTGTNNTCLIYGATGLYESTINTTWTTRQLSRVTLTPTNDGRVMRIGAMDAGGFGGGGSCEIYNPSTNTWTATAPWGVIGQGWGAACVAVGGDIYKFGGYASGAGSAVVQKYNIASDTWSTELPMPIGLKTMSGKAVLLNNGKILISGGTADSSTPAPPALYTIGVGAVQAGTMNTPRQYSAVTKLADGRVLLAGGVNGAFADLSTCEIYDPNTNTWSETAHLSTVRTRLISGAYSDYNFAQTYDDGSVWSVGGQVGTDTGTAIVERWDSSLTAADSWVAQPSMLETSSPYGAVVYMGGNRSIVFASQVLGVHTNHVQKYM